MNAKLEAIATTDNKIEEKSVRHTFSSEERNEIGGNLARAIGAARGIEAEFDQVKASYKAKTAEATARIDNLSTQLMNGFEMRKKRCRVEFNPKLRKKYYRLEDDAPDSAPVLVEDMTQDDFQDDLIRAEAKFHHREEIVLFPQAGNDSGILVVGRFNEKWYAALRAKIGRCVLEERLDSEQPCNVNRFDAITRAANRFIGWTLDSLGKDVAKGFADPVSKAIEPHKERVE